MAKSMRLNYIGMEQGNLTSGLPSGSFWEHWFETQSPRFPNRNLDEHSIWEKAVSIGVLAAEKEKQA